MIQLNNSIFNFNKGFKKEQQRNKVRKICKKYLKKGAEKIILGCTEFAVMLSDEKFPKINTIDILIDATINLINLNRLLKKDNRIK